ncbi:hypothetical protein Vqi01_59900 [Micromonospora qiuiae]|uniref:Uncharacterized protein n=1 Tax=Micromonospora qiuiae TaxID=502268 RepID=A0ABQ4JJQ0_9ACTN|nr:hypothetical protein Vqi01_59900 [Micromonospora qiuiae]
MTRPVLQAADHTARAAIHHQTAESLLARTEEWAAVCYFYASLHRVRAALLADPIFGDPPRLATKNPALHPSDAHCTKHMGYTRMQNGRRKRVWGLNELVFLLYPAVAASYELLYNSSLEVRYQQGLATLSLQGASGHADFIREEFVRGNLRA